MKACRDLARLKFETFKMVYLNKKIRPIDRSSWGSIRYIIITKGTVYNPIRPKEYTIRIDDGSRHERRFHASLGMTLASLDILDWEVLPDE